MKRTQRSRHPRAILAASFAGLLAATTMVGGCSDHAQSGALIDAGVGAVAGQAIGRNTESTVGGALIGAGVGYAIGSNYERGGRRHGHGHGHGHRH